MPNNLLRVALTRATTPENITDEERRAVTPPARPNTPNSPLANFVENATEETGQVVAVIQPADVTEPSRSVIRPTARRQVIQCWTATSSR
jgi:hypothetical protein